MAIYAIGDLHLSLNEEKPMDIFGENWKQHEEKIKQNWLETVKENDLVLLSGDFSWKMHLRDMYEDFKYLNDLPGKKILLKGNHDYWWTTLNKMREFIQNNQFTNIDFLYNNSYEYENVIIVGTRGWALNDTEKGEKMHHREEERLKLSLQDAIKKDNKKEIICMMHYPPIVNMHIENIDENSLKSTKSSNYVDIMKKFNVKMCIYGHLHGKAHEEAVEGQFEGINFKLVSADYLNFRLSPLGTSLFG